MPSLPPIRPEDERAARTQHLDGAFDPRSEEQRDPYGIDTLFMFMANMAWNSAMNPIETIRCLTAQDDKGDVFALTSISTGPVGGHDKIYRIVPAD